MPPLSLAPSDSRIGNRAASVLPDPVGATMRTCEPARISDSARVCISFIFEISARWSNCASPVLPDLLRSSVTNNAGDRTRLIKTVRRAGRTHGSTLVHFGGKVGDSAYGTCIHGRKGQGQPAEWSLSAKLRLDESACLLIGTVCLPESNCVLLAVSPDETETHPRPRPVETLLFHNTKILSTNLAILASP